MKKIILSAGGTGGHLFPAQSLAKQLHPDYELLFVGGALSKNAYFDKDLYPFKEIDCSAFSLNLRAFKKNIDGFKESRKIIQNFQPDLVIGFGSFFTLPLLMAATYERVPFLLHEQNVWPGKVNRLFALFARATTYSFSDRYIRGAAIKVDFPLREKKEASREASAAYFGLSPDRPTLLVFGGSQGAKVLNQMALEVASELKEMQILHFTGNRESADLAQKVYAEKQIKACVKPFEREMSYAFTLADVALTRAGAATMAELIAYEVPALLVPFPFAADNHQEKNAEHFAFTVKGGSLYKEALWSPATLVEKLRGLLANKELFKSQIAAFKKMESCENLKDVVERYLHAKR